ncbi:uncharacterized protein LOC109139201 [Larimichthys crocea]|uniref:uncharacterized protein LOC109139201 n=1 Tax=Larimichthys crocea TaxID=215358 RepID=UPI000F5E1400|nr:uncharacterized protein LOC109139201 [Larimichthys crocea]
MMTMSGGVLSVLKLKSINDLKKIDFGTSVPKHSLLLLYWFANTVDLDSNNVIWLTFNPNLEDYGSHYYGNYEGMLNPLPEGYRYYTVGNLYEDTTEELPSYVRNPPREYRGRNMDRIIFRVQEQKARQTALQRIDQVYITQHYEHQGTYNPNYTYQITANLLRQIREFSVGGNQLLHLRNHFGSNANDLDLRHIRNIWGDLACLGLLLFIVIQEKYSSIQQTGKQQPKQKTRAENNKQENNKQENNKQPDNSNRPDNGNRPEITRRVENNNRPENPRRVENSISYGGASLDAPQNPSEPSEPLVDNPELFSCLFCFALICFVFYILTAF